MCDISIALADSIMYRFEDPDDIPYRPWCYVQGYVLAGFEKLLTYTGDAKYFNYILKFVDQHVMPDGSLRDFTGDNLDDIMAGTLVVALYEHTQEEKYRIAANHICSKFDDYPRNADGGFWHSKSLPHEMWIDGVFMGMMFLMRYGSVIGDADYCFDETTRQILVFAERCRKADTGLFLHGYDEAKRASWADRETGLSSDVWSEGLGWYALILVETLARLPTTHPKRDSVMQILQELVEGLRKTQDPHTGLWYQVVDKGDHEDNWQDSSGSGMFIYCIRQACDLGYVSREVYDPVAKKGYQGLRTKMVINDDGLVDIYDACDGVCVQDSYAAYINYPKQVNAKEAVGSCLWATTIVEKPSAAVNS
jgi:rhamnogalacturonyl hydrolase YesR